jgi:DnaJ-class molecular chaperone
MQNHYETLSINSSATEDEIRRAYRILARRYHPDVNPGETSAERFKAIAEAYAVLRDKESKQQYDIELEKYLRKNVSRQFKAYEKQQRRATATERYYKAQKADYEKIKEWQEQRARAEAEEAASAKKSDKFDLKTKLDTVRKSLKGLLESASSRTTDNKSSKPAKSARVSKISILEVSVTIFDVISGVRKTVEIEEPEGSRKINVRIPAGVRNGSIVRLRANNLPGEEVVLIIRVARHPFLSIEQKGLMIEIPITINEAISGATIKVPTLEDPVMLKIPPNTSSGTELRLRGRGIPEKDSAGDLFVRLMIKVPESEHAVGIKDRAADLDLYYEHSVRQDLPKTLLEF